MPRWARNGSIWRRRLTDSAARDNEQAGNYQTTAQQLRRGDAFAENPPRQEQRDDDTALVNECNARDLAELDGIDSSKRKRTLSEFKGKTVVLEWSSPSCPFAKAQYVSGRMPELQKWAEHQGVVWLTVLSSHPSRSDYLEPEKAEAFNRGRGGVPSALLIDASGAVGGAYGAKTANHMFIVGKDGVLVYAGGIDDGETMDPKKVLAAHSYVRPALEEVLAGRTVRVSATQPFGCALAYAG